ncbi:diguanylate cyclase (GGDEF)-like protein/putative nucleotidyltransferase with HDIG domain [Thermodesulfitimonas autotrophica]|uniref:Diguanylate cyclase (GGDEF)-like protein/putative nucleotidyltransferase with HDIG domain n=1 Tax=Thermodesulfitimonas autotrophica TaxID=1894989 RepID=A0A3N5C0G8_9THEO|nr:diguanylate cyclase [Thermodesulfitimonas autotrophica]RPF49651.1 diguanylate cyclase (GGDEF)-like protein/putative nucleotidyltransferase with HDIG domain [Thermodesulfitimonas autotrophica]
MREWEKKRSEELSEHVLVTHIVSLLVFFAIITSFYNFKLGVDFSQCLKVNLLMSFFAVCIAVYILRKLIPRAIPLTQTRTDELLLLAFVLPLTFGFLWYSKSFFSTKLLIMIPVIIAATAFGRYGGIGTALFAGALLFLLDYRVLHALPEKTFQTDLIVSSVAVFAAWVVGGLMEIEKKTQRELIKLADYDHLTGLYNHRYLQERLTLSLKEAAAKNFPVALVLFDIDQFRYYNSVYGYQKGDEILAAIGRLLLEEVKEPNYAARYGADEFMVVFPGMNKEEALVEADRLGKEIGARATLCLEAAGNGSKPFTVSTGIATYPADGDAAVPLIRAAEDDLFRTKYSGGKTYLYRSVLSEICTLKIQEAFPTLQSLVALINARDRYTFGHSERVLSYALALAEKLGLPEAEKEVLRYGAYLHDLGKIEIEPAILNKPTRLSTEEWAIMKNHTVWGSEMLKSLPAFREILPLLRSHHENYDGSGYPDQLKGKEIPLLARILRLADSFDAMTTDRPYRKALSFAAACQEIEKHAGSLYDPELVPLFLKVIKEAAAKSPRLGAAESSRERVAEHELKKASG